MLTTAPKSKPKTDDQSELAESMERVADGVEAVIELLKERTAAPEIKLCPAITVEAPKVTVTGPADWKRLSVIVDSRDQHGGIKSLTITKA